VEPGAIVETLRATLLEEEGALDERIVRRVIAAAGREVSAGGLLRPVPDGGERRSGEPIRLRALPPVPDDDPPTAGPFEPSIDDGESGDASELSTD
jgi:hypothetical protein